MIEEMFAEVKSATANEAGEFEVVEVKDKGLEKALELL